MEYINELTMNNGLKAKIISTNGVHDIDILFENGIIVRHKDYYRFLLGQIKCPMKYTLIDNCVKCENPNTGDVFAVDKTDLEKVVKYKFWNIDKSSGYVKTGSGVYLHRLITNCPDGLFVDHINGEKEDNRQINLRICSVAQNSYNRGCSKNSKTKLRGITKRGNSYRVKISKDGKQYSLGSFKDINEAISVYDKHCILLFGEFARPNVTETKVIPTKPSWVK